MSYLEKIYSLNGLRVVVTGASSGLGLHQAVALANCGATVFALSRTGTPKVDINMPVPKNVHFGSLTFPLRRRSDKKSVISVRRAASTCS